MVYERVLSPRVDQLEAALAPSRIVQRQTRVHDNSGALYNVPEPQPGSELPPVATARRPPIPSSSAANIERSSTVPMSGRPSTSTGMSRAWPKPDDGGILMPAHSSQQSRPHSADSFLERLNTPPPGAQPSPPPGPCPAPVRPATPRLNNLPLRGRPPGTGPRTGLAGHEHLIGTGLQQRQRDMLDRKAYEEQMLRNEVRVTEGRVDELESESWRSASAPHTRAHAPTARAVRRLIHAP